MDKDKILAFIDIMSVKLDDIREHIAENGCTHKAIEEFNHLIGDVLVIKAVIKDNCIEKSI